MPVAVQIHIVWRTATGNYEREVEPCLPQPRQRNDGEQPVKQVRERVSYLSDRVARPLRRSPGDRARRAHLPSIPLTRRTRRDKLSSAVPGGAEARLRFVV